MSVGRGAPHRRAFLVYDSRSGSTLLAALLNRVAAVSVSQESRFVARVLEYRGALAGPESLAGLLAYLDEEMQFRELTLDRAALGDRLARARRPWTRRAVIDTLVETYFAERDAAATVHVVKSGRVILHAHRLRALYPDALFIHAVRDGRAVFQSKRSTRATSGEPMATNVVKAALDWRVHMARAAALGGAMVQVRYEDLLADPEAQVERVCDAFGLAPWQRRRSKSQDDYARGIGRRQRHLHSRVAGAPVPARALAWRDALAPWEIAVYQQVAARALDTAGYPLIATAVGRARVLGAVAWLWCALWLRRAVRAACLARRPARLARRLQEKLHERAA